MIQVSAKLLTWLQGNVSFTSDCCKLPLLSLWLLTNEILLLTANTFPLICRFTNALAGQSANDMIQRTSGRLDTLHSEGIHRLSDITCSAVSQLLMLGKSIIAHANKLPKEDAEEDVIKVDWPEDSVDRAKLIREKAQTMAGYVEAVSNSFITGIADVAEAYLAAIKGTTTAADSREDLPKKSIEEKAKTFAQLLRSDHITAVGKIRDGLQYLSYVIISTSMPAAAAA
ncbi:unnamed protein product [Linum tenue]|uniref:DUF7798 domain-containing protein n=1 Tax=Linum tenue TaxID=586396 RepID=A0AAV0JBS3_9ROSI|nr:unnamed protein product [Linum tenue]